MAFYIIKSSGEKELFNLKKLRRSLRRSGADDALANMIVDEVRRMRPKSTNEIHAYASKRLQQEDRPIAARYNLKRALIELGPAGYPFEQFVSKLFAQMGYNITTNARVRGTCISHEIDLLAHKDKTTYLVECKFHNSHGLTTPVTVALYIRARFEDIDKRWQQKHHSDEQQQAWIVTNTRFTSEAHTYAECVNIKLTSWNQPAGESLAETIDRLGLHPITALTSLTKAQKRALVERNCVLCKDLNRHVRLLENMGLTKKRINRALHEAEKTCSL